MAKIINGEPQSASDYDDRTTAAVKTVLIEIGQIPAQDGNAAIDIIVVFLMPRDAQIVKNSPPVMADFAVQRADGVDLAMRFYQFVAFSGNMPSGCTNTVEIAVSSIAALLAMKGHAINGRFRKKDAYDIYYCVRNYSGGHEALAEHCRPLLAHPSGATGYAYIVLGIRLHASFRFWNLVRQ